MLAPENRRLFLGTLRPPDGYAFDRAIGTTFTLDLMTLLSVPLAFTFRDAHDGEGELSRDPLAMLESARQSASRIALFCQGGRTSVPRPGQHALAFIEDSVIQVFPPHDGPAGAVFHPKIWLLRYESADGPVRYRLVCQSRNLTFDSSWDLSLVLDGELNESRTGEIDVNLPLSDFIRALPGMAASPISAGHLETVELLAREVGRVEFRTPRGLSLSRFLHLGIHGSNAPYPDRPRRRLLVISPFLDGGFLKSVVARRRGCVLISRREELLKVPHDAVAAFDRVYAFRTALEPEPEDADDAVVPLAGLHAKMFVIDDGWNARLAVGSANATGAALGNPPRNVEFMVELVGKRSRFGIDALLSAGKDGEAGTLVSLIEEFDKEEAGTVEEAPEDLSLERLLDAAADTLARCDIWGQVEATDGGRYTLRLKVSEPAELPPEVSEVSCWPVTLRNAGRSTFRDGAEFTGLSLQELSGFLAIEVRADYSGRSGRKRFARTIALSGTPNDRLQQLLASMLSDRNRLMQLLWLLLSPMDDMSFGDFAQALNSGSERSDWGAVQSGMLERMLETLGRDPAKLDSVATLIADLKKTESGAQLVDEELGAAWSKIWRVREKLR